MLKKRTIIIKFILICQFSTNSMENDISISSLFDSQQEESVLEENSLKNGVTYSANSIYINKEDKVTYLHQLARVDADNYISEIEILINLGCRLNDKNAYGQTPLHVAIIWGNLKFIQDLFKFCCDNDLGTNQLNLNIKDNKSEDDNDGKTAFERCLDKFYLECDKKINNEKFQKYSAMLIEFLNIHNTQVDPSYFPLHSLISQKNIDFDKIEPLLNLISLEYFNLQDSYGDTVLHKAVRFGHKKIVNYLIEKKVNIDIQNKASRTIFNEALLYKNLLCAYNIINFKEIDYTKLMKHVKNNELGQIKNEITNNKANLLDKNKFGMTAFHVATINNSKQALIILLTLLGTMKKIDPNNIILQSKDDFKIDLLELTNICSNEDCRSIINKFLIKTYDKQARKD